MNYTKDVLGKAPKSMCRCGHAGDGYHSDHRGLQGHGPCSICRISPCGQFTWTRRLTDEEKVAWITRDMALRGRVSNDND